jgi:hypothetical protein
MTDSDRRTESRVQAAFLEERRRAERDLRVEPLAPRGRQRPRTVARLAAAAIVVVVAIATAGVIGSLPGRGSTVPTASHSTSAGAATPSVAPTESTPGPTRTFDVTGRYPDGIPTTFDGQPVIRWDAALARRTTSKDATSFFTGVWLNIYTGIMFCPSEPLDPSQPPTTWLQSGGCQLNYVSAEAGATPTTQLGITTFRFYEGTLSTGPAIMRVRIHDPRATQCGYQASTCDKMIVVDDIVWSGDAVTDPHPLSVAQVIAATSKVSPATELQFPARFAFACADNVTDGLRLCPSFQSTAPATSSIAGVNVLPSAEALARALPDAQQGVDAALRSTPAMVTGVLGMRRLVVDNVEVLVWTDYPTASGPDRAFLTQLYDALKAQEHGA